MQCNLHEKMTHGKCEYTKNNMKIKSQTRRDFLFKWYFKSNALYNRQECLALQTHHLH